MVEVFKTNVQTEGQAEELAGLLRHRDIESWSLDLEDCDKVLRVLSRAGVAEFVINTLVKCGYECTMLDCEYSDQS